MPYSDWRTIETISWLRAPARRLTRGVVGVCGAFVDWSDAIFFKVERFLGVPAGKLSSVIRVRARSLATRMRNGATRAWTSLPGAVCTVACVRRLAHGCCSQVRAVISRRPWALGMALSGSTLGALCALDAILGYPPSTRFLYILPIWLATRLSGPCAGLGAVVTVSALLADLDSSASIAGASQTNSVVRLMSLTVIMLAIYHVEGRLQAAQAQARLDPLTGVLNRLELRKRISYALEAMRRQGRTVTIAVVDCDRFKEVNDTFGHSFGDYVLRVLARRLVHATRNGGVVGRVGGDEFVVLFEGLGYDAARSLMEAAERTFSAHMNSLGCATTLSYGLAVANPEGEDPDRLIQVADARMYSKKRQAVCVTPAPNSAQVAEPWSPRSPRLY